MSIIFRAYQDADGVITKYQEGGEEELRAAADPTLTRVPAKDDVTSNDLLTDETPVLVAQIPDFTTESSGAAPVQSVAGRTGDVVVNQTDVGLPNVDNTSDSDKPVSTAQQAALDLKYDASNPSGFQTAAQVTALAQTLIDALVDSSPATLDTLNELAAAIGDDPNFAVTVANQIAGVQANLDTHINDLNNPHATTAAQVGLGNVDNTSDADKPVSTAQQAALDLKANAADVYTQTELDGGQLDNRYFTEAEVSAQQAVQDTAIAQNVTDIAQNATDLATESAARAAADVVLQSQINTNISDIAQEIADRTAADTALQGQITSNDTDIAANAAAIATNAADIAQEITDRTNADANLQSQITSNDTDIAANASAIATNAANIASNDTDIATNAAAIAANAANITANDGDIATNAAAIATNAANIASNDTDIATNAGNIATNAANIASNDTDIAANAAAIATNAADIASNDTDIATNAGNIATNAANIASNDTDIATNAGAIATNAADIAQEITDRTNADAGLQAQITANDGDITTLQGEQATQDAAIALNTAKVSADGSIGTHSDVDLTGAATDDILVRNALGVWVPRTISNGFTIFPIWAEENGGLSNNNTQWSFGNGATGNIGIVVPFDCELFAISLNAETFGTSVSVDIRADGTTTLTTPVFTAADQFQNITAIPVTAGTRIGFRTNTENGAAQDVRVCAWFRVQATAAFPTPDRSIVTASGVGFTATTFATIPGMSTTVNLTGQGDIDAIINYSAARTGAANAIAEFRVVINGDNGQSFSDTLSAFNDNGSAAHFVAGLPAGTYTVEAQAQVDNPITIQAVSLTATAVED